MGGECKNGSSVLLVGCERKNGSRVSNCGKTHVINLIYYLEGWLIIEGGLSWIMVGDEQKTTQEYLFMGKPM